MRMYGVQELVQRSQRPPHRRQEVGATQAEAGTKKAPSHGASWSAHCCVLLCICHLICSYLRRDFAPAFTASQTNFCCGLGIDIEAVAGH